MKSFGALALLLVACASDPGPKEAQQGSIKDVVVVVKGSDEPLPFDPRGGRLTIVTQEIAKLMGHHVVLELDTALSPELKASLEETVLASFQNFARELVLLQREDPEMFAKARLIERLVCVYDAVAKESDGKLEKEGKWLVVRSPPDRFPLLEKWIVSQAVYDAHIQDLEARWGEADPTKLSPREQALWFAYMTKTRPGAGYLWIFAREKKRASGERDDTFRVEHIGRIARLAGVVEKRSPLEKKVREFLLENAAFLGGFHADPPSTFKADPAVLARVLGAYEAWLNANVGSFDDAELLVLQRAVLEHRNSVCGRECSPDGVFPGFDRFAFGMSIYGRWVEDGAKTDLPPGPKGELYKTIVCPAKRRGEAETEIKYGCSTFFSVVLADEKSRARLAETVEKRNDSRLLEQALLNIGHNQGEKALELIESMRDDGHFRFGLHILFHDHARRDDVKAALEKAAPRWWRDHPKRRGVALLIMARQHEGLHVHYGDNHWSTFVKEFGGPIQRDVLGAFLAEGVRAIEMTPKIWPALAKTKERDEVVANHLVVILTRDRELRTSRATPVLVLLRSRLCEEKNAAGFQAMRASMERWAKEHPDGAPQVANALADFQLAKCKQPPKERDD